MVSFFRAPWGRDVIIVTGLGTLVLGLPMLRLLWLPGSTIAMLILASVPAIAALLCVRGYEVRPGVLLIKRLLWDTAWPIDSGARATVRPEAMKGSWRVWGNDGMFAITGRFSGSGLGRYRAFVTDPARTVILETRHGTIVVSPDRPDDFARAIGQARLAA